MVDTAKIKSKREALGLTMDEAAMRAGFVNPEGKPIRQRWYDIESGRRNPSADALHAVARAIECTMDELMKTRSRRSAK